MSKVGVTVMTFIQQRELNSREDIVVNAVRLYITNINISLHMTGGLHGRDPDCKIIHYKHKYIITHDWGSSWS